MNKNVVHVRVFRERLLIYACASFPFGPESGNGYEI